MFLKNCFYIYSCVCTHSPIWLTGYILSHLLTFRWADIVRYYCVNIWRLFHPKKNITLDSNVFKRSQNSAALNIWRACNRLCRCNQKAANGNILLILFVIDLLMDCEGWLKEMIVILWAQFVPACGVAMTVLLDWSPECPNEDHRPGP